MNNLQGYIDLVVDAKNNGGPIEYLNEIYKSGVRSGRKEILIFNGVAVLLVVSAIGIKELIKQKKRDKAKIEEVKNKLIKEFGYSN